MAEIVKGDIFVHNRKGKTLYVWDINMTLRWKGIAKGAEGEDPAHEAGGRLDCIDITVADDDFDTKFHIDTGDNAQGREFLAVVKSKSAAIVKKEWKAMTTLMAELHSNSAKVGTANAAAAASSAANTSVPSSTPSSTAVPKASSPAAPTPSSSTSTTKSGDKLAVRSSTQTVKFETTAELLFQSLTDVGRVSAFTGSAAQISTEKGSAFKIFGGSVQGTMEDIVPNQRIVQKWRFASWPAEHYSTVTIDITAKDSKCLVKLTQTDIPETDFDRTRLGWEEHFWRRIKGVFGWNYKVKA